MQFFFSHFWLSSRLIVEETDCFTTSNHLIVRECMCVCYKMSQPSKSRRFLQSSEIAELFLDNDSGDATVSSDASSVEGSPECVPGVSHTQVQTRMCVYIYIYIDTSLSRKHCSNGCSAICTERWGFPKTVWLGRWVCSQWGGQRLALLDNFSLSHSCCSFL